MIVHRIFFLCNIRPKQKKVKKAKKVKKVKKVKKIKNKVAQKKPLILSNKTEKKSTNLQSEEKNRNP